MDINKILQRKFKWYGNLLKIFTCGNIYQLMKTYMMNNLLVESLYQNRKVELFVSTLTILVCRQHYTSLDGNDFFVVL